MDRRAACRYGLSGLGHRLRRLELQAVAQEGLEGGEETVGPAFDPLLLIEPLNATRLARFGASHNQKLKSLVL